MTDAPAPNAPAPPSSTPAPTSHEAVIDQSPVGSPAPIGNQAPDKPPGESRREAIQKAFDKAAKAPVADAKIGHNKPPEATPKDKPKVEVKAPQDGQQPQEGRQRGERGRFAPREQNKDANTNAALREAGTPGEQKPGARLPDDAPYRDPPPRMGEHAKAEWATAPESVRGEVHRMAKETADMYRAYRPDHDEMNRIRHFHQMATEHGTTLERALTNYTTMEQKLRTDVIGGLDIIVNNLGLRTNEGQPITLRDIAYHIATQSPEALQQVQSRNAQGAQSHQIGSLHEKIEGLENTLKQMHYETQFRGTRSAVDEFAESHPRFDELGEEIEHELSHGYDLAQAYARACLLRPSTTHAAQTRDPPAQTRTDKSISGAPDGSSNGVAPPRRKSTEKPVGRRESIGNAIKRANGNFA